MTVVFGAPPNWVLYSQAFQDCRRRKAVSFATAGHSDRPDVVCRPKGEECGPYERAAFLHEKDIRPPLRFEGPTG